MLSTCLISPGVGCSPVCLWKLWDGCSVPCWANSKLQPWLTNHWGWSGMGLWQPESCFVPVGIAAGMWHTVLHSKCHMKGTVKNQTGLFLALCATGKALNRSVPGPMGSAAWFQWGRIWLLSLAAVIPLCSQVLSVLSQLSPKAPLSDRTRKFINVCFTF